jgi:glutathione peroxidase-family protein
MGISLSRPESDASSFHALKARDIDGNSVDFATLRGKVVLVSNVASK